MMSEDLRRLAQASIYRLAFDRYLRTGLGPVEPHKVVLDKSDSISAHQHRLKALMRG